MKILFISQDCIGGAERVTLTFSKQLASECHEVIFGLVRLKNIKAKSLENILPNNYKRTIILWNNQLSLFVDLYLLIKKENPDVIFASAMHLNQRLLILKKIFFPKIKVIVRNENYLYTLPWYKKCSLRLTYPIADMIITQTEEMENEMKAIKLKPEHIRTVINPIDIEDVNIKLHDRKSFSAEDTSFKYLAIGRMSSQKGFDILIRAFKEVKEFITNSKLYILGDINYEGGSYYKYLCSIADELSLKDDVVFLGYSNNPYVYMRDADVYVMSSRNEGLPNSLLEAQYIGCKIVATKCIPVIERIIMDGKNGFLAEPENVVSLAQAMIKAYNTKIDLTSGHDNHQSKEIIDIVNSL